MGGIITNSKRDIRENVREVKKTTSLREVHCLHPGDLYPFTRKALFIVIDSNNSFAFQHIPRHFGQPIAILMSPVELPHPFQGDIWKNINTFYNSLHIRK